MSRLLMLLCLAGMLLAGCGSAAPSTGNSAATVQPAVSSTQPTVAPAPAAGDCPVTEAILDEPPKDPNSDPFGRGYWYINADRTIWADVPESQSWGTGDAKVIWIRPQGTQLVVTGQRLDGDAPQLRADIPCCYPTGFQATGLNFPTGGCWEVTARAGKNELRFVTYVTPKGGV